jgi:uncharacterized protein
VIYEGSVRHRRFAVAPHEFSYRVAMAYIELEECPPHVPDAGGPVRKLTLPRRLGKDFNPVSFYYAFDTAEQVQAVVAEVTSTPWGERHSYVLRRDGNGDGNGDGGGGGNGDGGGDGGPVLRGEFVKRLHVSPFMGMEQTYSWRLTAPGETVSVHIESFERGVLAFDATLNLRRAPARTRATSPWRVLAQIYGQALALRLKGVRIHPHPGVTT